MTHFSDMRALLDRYWEGETTLEEERALKAYFASGQVDERLRSIVPLFQALREEQTVQYTKPKTVELRPVHFAWQKLAAAAAVALLLTAGMWWWGSQEKLVQGQIAEQPAAAPPPPIVQQEKSVVEETKIAAAEETKPPVLAKKTNTKRKKLATAKPLDPETEQAMEEIMAALALVSSKIKKGKQEAAKGAIHLEAVDKVFKKKSEG